MVNDVERQTPRSSKVTRPSCIYGRHRRECTEEAKSAPSAVGIVAR